MRIELMLNKLNLSDVHFSKIDDEFNRTVLMKWPDANIRVRLGGGNNLTVLGGFADDKELVQAMLQDMFDEVDDWLYNDIDMY